MTVTEITGLAIGAYRNPRGAIGRLLSGGMAERHALALLMLGCILLLIAAIPDAVGLSGQIAAEDARNGAIAAYLFAYICVAPLLFYGLAAFVHLGVRRFGALKGFLRTRVAVFLGVFLAGPLAIASGMASTVLGDHPAVQVIGMVVFGFWLWLLAALIAEASGFVATWRVFAALTLVFVTLAFVIAIGLPDPASKA